MDKIPPTNPPISPNANYFGSFNGQNSQNNQNSKNSSQKFKKFKDFFVTMLESFKKLQSEEHNNDSKNTITNSNTTAQILIPTNPYGSGNEGNNRFDIQTQGQSATIEKNGRGDTTAYNGGFDRICGAESRRSGGEGRESRAMGEGSQGLGRGSRILDERSEIIKEIYQQKAWLTNDELNSLNTLETKSKEEHSILKYLLNKQGLESAIKDSLKSIENAKNTIQLTNHAKTLDKTLTTLKKICPNDFNDKEIKELIKIAEEKLKPLKEKYLSKENTHKSKSKSNDDFGIGM